MRMRVGEILSLLGLIAVSIASAGLLVWWSVQ